MQLRSFMYLCMYACMYVRWRVGVLYYQDRGGGAARDSAAAGAVSDQLLHDGSAGCTYYINMFNSYPLTLMYVYI